MPVGVLLFQPGQVSQNGAQGQGGLSQGIFNVMQPLNQGKACGSKTFLTLNLRHGGGTRILNILGYLREQDADLLCLTEFRLGPRGQDLIEGLESLGYKYRVIPAVEPKLNTAALFSKRLIEPAKVDVPEEIKRHLMPILFEGILVLGAYFPQGKAKAPVFDWLLEGSKSWLKGQALILGDFNTGLHKIDEEGSTFYCEDQFRALLGLGWRDAYREFHGSERVYTWISNQKNGFRVDHAFVTKATNFTEVAYDHSTRTSGLTDHSSMKLVLGI